MSPAEKADLLAHRSAAYRTDGQFTEAERSLAEAIEIYSAINADQQLIDAYSSLCDIQIESGKFSSALHSLTTLRDLHRRRTDKAGEIRSMVEIGRIHLSVGNIDEAIVHLKEANLNSDLYRINEQNALSQLYLGISHTRTRQFRIAASYFTQASTLFLVQNNLPRTLEAIAGAIHSLLQTGDDAEAYRYLTQYENIVLAGGSAVNASEAYAQCGFAFLKNERWETAKACFDKAAASPFPPSSDGMARIAPYIGIGEILFHNFAFVEAQQNFIKAYSIAKNHSNIAAQAYLMVRIGDCEMKKSISGLSQERSIRSMQFYEHAQNLFARTGIPSGEAIVLQRIGTVKEAAGDNNSAIAYYKRAFEKFAGVSAIANSTPEAIDPAALVPWSRTETDIYHSHAERLIALLIAERKFSDALSVIERCRAYRIRDEVIARHLKFREPHKDSLYAAWEQAFSTHRSLSAELARFTKNTDHEYYSRLQRNVADVQRSGSESLRRIIERYPEFGILSAGTLSAASVPLSTTVLRYHITSDACWVFAVREGKEVTALKTSSYGSVLSGKMNRYIEGVAKGNSRTDAFTALSEELYAVLIRPVEQFGGQRFVIVPPDGFEKFPFHALTKNGKPLMEMIEVSYLPSLYFLKPSTAMPNLVATIAAFGFSSDTRWGLEFELRDIRSFFRNVTLFLNQSATLKQLEDVSGEVLHLSTRFGSTIGNERTFILSDGTASLMGVTVPVSQFTALHTFPIVILNDITPRGNSVTGLHSLLWLLNGSAAVITNEFPLTPKGSKTFVENFYSGYSATLNPFHAYRKAMVELNTQGNNSGQSLSSSYFYYGL
jgi:tetratricopeptide (TPR) repeat protein